MAQRAIQTVSIGEQSACAPALCSLAALTVRAICAADPCQSVAEAIESVAAAIDASFTAAPPPALLPRLPNTPTLTPRQTPPLSPPCQTSPLSTPCPQEKTEPQADWAALPPEILALVCGSLLADQHAQGPCTLRDASQTMAALSPCKAWQRVAQEEVS